MLQHIAFAVRMNAEYAKAHLEDIPPDQWTHRPAGLDIHPAALVGHLATSYDFVASLLGVPRSLPDGWDKLFEHGSAAMAEPGAYPPKDALLAALAGRRQALLEVLEKATPEDLARPNPDERMRQFIPTVGDLLLLMLTVHEGIHLGQLAAWRLAMELPLRI